MAGADRNGPLEILKMRMKRMLSTLPRGDTIRGAQVSDNSKDLLMSGTEIIFHKVLPVSALTHLLPLALRPG